MKARPYFSKPPAGFRPRRPLIERSTNADGSVDVRRLTIAIPASAWRELNGAVRMDKPPKVRRRKKA